ncbi:glycoside hydrolase family 32 protein [Sinomonas flava]|uniref:beta-fructofuranosidase n=1 Tax=Sinomonas flava TaxID=496857 RepID=A0ABN3BQB4_9MICC
MTSAHTASAAVVPATIGADASAAHPDRSFPRLHPRPSRGWVNDPNGVAFADGRWHVFFQHNAESARHHRIHWGHVSSPDLVRWEEHPVALAPQQGGPDAYGCWTGVVTLDAGTPTAVYSGVADGSGRSQVVLARGTADLGEWVQDGVVAAGMPDDPRVVAVRDPFLFEFAGRRWAVQGAGLATGHAAVLLYGADDLSAWEYHGIWLTSEDPVASELPDANIWECPQLVRSGGSWVAVFSLWREEQLTGVGHLVGSLALDPVTALPVFTPLSSGITDVGGSFYAPQAVQAGERVLMWGWAKEVAASGLRGRTPEDCDAVGWSGLLTFPRELRVEGGAVRLQAAPELAALRAEPLEDTPGTHDGGPQLPLPDQADAVVAGEGTVRLRLGDATVWSGAVAEGEEVRVLVDASIVEVFTSAGAATTLRAYPSGAQSYRLEMGPGVRARAWRLAVPGA